MTSSAIPARLLFQCGHAALVTLPRVKGENAAQRNERVAREKSNALARQCDFCGPAVEVAAQTNGSHVEVAEVLAAEPVVIAEPAELLDEPVAAVEEPVPVMENELEEFVLVPDVEEPLTIAEEVEQPVLVIEEPVVVLEEQPIVVEVVEEVVQPAKRTRRATRHRQSFAVEYRAERVVRAADIRDALRQASALGATDILAIERIR
jgi:hypothetical protein